MRIFYFMCIIIISLYGEVTNKYPTLQLVNSNLKIIDIRTEKEWKQTGILPKAYTITFFRADGSYDFRDFLNKLNKIIKKDEVFAIICRSGHRSKIVSNFLSKNGYHVINLVGGMNYATKKLGLPVKKYLGNKF